MYSMKWMIPFWVSALILPLGVRSNFAAERETINIGCIASLTGYLSDQAQNLTEGMDLAIERINSRGGLLGRQIKAFYRDDEMKPPVGARRFEDLVKNQAIVMHSGAVFAPVAMAIEQTNKQLGEKGIVLFEGASSHVNQNPQNMQPSLFFSGSSLEAYGLAGGEFMTQVGGKRGFLLYTDYAWGWVIRDGFVKSAKANGGEILAVLPIPPGTTDFGPFLTQVMAKKPDYVAVISNGMMFINCMKQAYALGMKDQMKFATFHVSSDEVISCGPEVIKDVYLITDYFWNIQTEKNRMFVEDFIKKYGSDRRPSLRHFLQHTAVSMWTDVVKKAGTVDPKTIVSGLVGFKGDFGKGEIEVRKTGDHTAIQPIVIARGKGPKEMKDKFDTQEIVKLVKGEQYFDSAKEKGW